MAAEVVGENDAAAGQGMCLTSRTWKRKGTDSPLGLWKKHHSAHILTSASSRDPFQISDLQSCVITHPCCFKPLSLRQFVPAAQETNPDRGQSCLGLCPRPHAGSRQGKTVQQVKVLKGESGSRFIKPKRQYGEMGSMPFISSGEPANFGQSPAASLTGEKIYHIPTPRVLLRSFFAKC